MAIQTILSLHAELVVCRFRSFLGGQVVAWDAVSSTVRGAVVLVPLHFYGFL
jgi:hypothetical protein